MALQLTTSKSINSASFVEDFKTHTDSVDRNFDIRKNEHIKTLNSITEQQTKLEELKRRANEYRRNNKLTKDEANKVKCAINQANHATEGRVKKMENIKKKANKLLSDLKNLNLEVAELNNSGYHDQIGLLQTILGDEKRTD